MLFLRGGMTDNIECRIGHRLPHAIRLNLTSQVRERIEPIFKKDRVLIKRSVSSEMSPDVTCANRSVLLDRAELKFGVVKCRFDSTTDRRGALSMGTF